MLITLLTGFVIVSAIDLGAPIWLVILLGVIVVLGGRMGVERAKRAWAAGTGDTAVA